MRQSSQQVQLPLDPPENFVMRRQESNVSQPPEVAHCGSTEMSKQARMRYQEVYNQNEEDGCCPSRDLVVAKLEVGVLSVGLYGFVAEEEEDPDTGADCCSV